MNKRNAVVLVGVNNFYASCERLFRPDLEGAAHRRALQQRWLRGGPVGGGQGTRHQDGVPYFQIRQFFEAMGGVWFSQQLCLYGDMSNGMTILEGGWRWRWRSTASTQSLYRAERIMGR